MSTILLIVLLLLSLYILSGVIRTSILYLKKGMNETYPIIDRIVDTLWLDKIYVLIYGEYRDDEDPYNFDSLD